MNREYHKWYSPHLGRQMELLVFGHAGARVLVFPTRSGRFFDYENFGMVGALQHKIEDGRLQLCCVDSIDAESLYNEWCLPQERILRHMEYEEYLLHEVLPLMESINSNPTLIAHGCSLGAFHAVNIAFRHPDRFDKVVALSGRYDLTLSIGNFRGLFDEYYDQMIYYHTPSHFVSLLEDETILNQMRKMEITLVIGEEDVFLENNKQFTDVLAAKKINHNFITWQGEAHRPRYWRKMVDLYL